MKVRLLMTLFVLSFAARSLAQQSDSLFIGKTFTEGEFTGMQREAAYNNRSHVGKRYPTFLVKTLAGDTLTNDSLKGKVCLLVFFYPGSNQINVDTLKSIKQHFQDLPFQIYLFTQETSGLVNYMREHNLHFPLCFFRTVQESWRMNFYNSIPSYVLLTQGGIVAKVTGLEGFSPEAYSEIIADLLKK